jgi:hypothetical protein
MAEYFKCSTVAIHKRRKRLLSTVRVAEVLSEHGLTGQQAEYALLRGQGLKPKQAALALCDVTSDDSARNRASQLENTEGVRDAIMKLMELHLPREHRIKTLRSLVDSKLPDIQIRALDQSWKLGDEYPNKAIDVNVSIQDMSDEALDARIHYLMSQMPPEELAALVNQKIIDVTPKKVNGPGEE